MMGSMNSLKGAAIESLECLYLVVVSCRITFSLDLPLELMYVGSRTERHPWIICYSKDRGSWIVGYRSVVEFDVRWPNSVFTVIWC